MTHQNRPGQHPKSARPHHQNPAYFLPSTEGRRHPNGADHDTLSNVNLTEGRLLPIITGKNSFFRFTPPFFALRINHAFAPAQPATGGKSALLLCPIPSPLQVERL
jgi:hypothetical protein